MTRKLSNYASDTFSDREASRLRLSDRERLMFFALWDLASWTDGPEVTNLFDAPGDAKRAREALRYVLALSPWTEVCACGAWRGGDGAWREADTGLVGGEDGTHEHEGCQ